MSGRKRTYASTRQAARRSSILAATRELIGKNGYDGATLQDVADLAGVAKRTIYNLYGSKDDLVLAAHAELVDLLSERVLETGATPGLQRVLASSEAFGEQVAAMPAYAEAMARALFRAKPGDRLVEAVILEPSASVRANLEVEQANGRLCAEADCAELGLQINGQRWWALLLWLLGAITLEQVAPLMAHSHLRTLASASRPDLREELIERLQTH